METIMAFLQRIIHDLLYVHPLHTLLVHFPIALLSAALFFILLALWKKSDLLEKIAFANLSLGAVSTIVAGIAGERDNLLYYRGLAANHGAKIVLAIVLFVLTSATALIRWRRPNLFHSKGKAVYVLAYGVSFLIVSVLGFLGGVIVYGF
jgi:uncharacterized membrane protein